MTIASDSRVVHCAVRGAQAVGRVVVVGHEGVGAVVDRLVAELTQTQRDLGLQLEARVIRSEMDAHVGFPPSAAKALARLRRALARQMRLAPSMARLIEAMPFWMRSSLVA